MHQCPKCNSIDVHRSRAKSAWESVRRDITGKRPFRCRACGWRGWGIDQGPRPGDVQRELAGGALAPDPSSLTGTAPGRDTRRHRGIDLAELDKLDLFDEKPDE